MSRTHHYYFGHITLRDIFFDNPYGLVVELTRRGEQLLIDIWDDIGQQLEEDNKADRLPAKGLEWTLLEMAPEIVAGIITLPPPQEPVEAHFVALVLPKSQNRRWLSSREDENRPRYVTLEYGLNVADGTTRTVLCEWVENRHKNLGDGPEPTVKAFAHKVTELVCA